MSTRDETLRAIVNAARVGARAPKNREISVAQLRNLIVDGVLRITLYSRHFRQIEILTGPHAGLKTMGHPHGQQPWKIIDGSSPYECYIRPKFRAREHTSEIFGGFDDAEMARMLRASEFKADLGGDHDLAQTPSGSGERPQACSARERPQPFPA